MRGRLTTGCILVLSAVLAQVVAASAPLSAVPEIKADLQWLTEPSSRVVGTAGHAAVCQRVETTLREFPRVRVWRHAFPVLSPATESASLALATGLQAGEHRVYPLWPAGVRLPTTPSGGLSGDLVYVAEGEFADLPPSGLRDCVAVMEVTGGDAWRTLFALGARAVLLLGSPEERFAHFGTHLFPVPLDFPRFYLPDGPLAADLRKTGRHGGTATIACKASWREACAGNLYALIPARAGAAPSKAVAIGVPLDSVSAVPDMAKGADAAVDVAAALALMRRLVASPPARPVLFVFFDAYAVDQLGVRRMLFAFGALPKLRDQLEAEELKLLDDYDESLALLRELEQRPDYLDCLYEMRYRDLHDYVKQEVQKEVLVIDAALEPLRLGLYKKDMADAERARADVEIKRLTAERRDFYVAQKQLVRDIPLTEELLPLATTLWGRARARCEGQLAELAAGLDEDTHCETLRRELVAALGLKDTPGNPVVPVAFLMGLDLSDAGIAAGPSLQDDFVSFNETRNAAAFTQWLQIQAQAGLHTIWPTELLRAVNLAPVRDTDGIQPDGANAGTTESVVAPEDAAPVAVNLLPLKGMESPISHRVSYAANLTGAAPSFGLPAMTWATLDGQRERVDTPNDRPEHLDWARLGPQVDATLVLLQAWVNDATFAPSPKVPVAHVLRIPATVVDQATGEPVARVPMAGYLAALLPGRSTGTWRLPQVPGVRRVEFLRTGVDGRCVFDVIPGDVGWSRRLASLEAYRIGSHGEILRVVNKAKTGKGIRLDVDRRWRKAQPLRATIFSCRGYSVADLFDPRFLMPLPQVSVLDARRGTPKRINSSLYDGMLCFFLEHGAHWQLLLRAGIVGNRMVLVNAGTAEESRDISVRDSLSGFTHGAGLPTHPFMQSARDFYNLDSRRLADYREAGIASKPIEMLQAETRDELEKAEAAMSAADGGDGEAFFRHAMAAMGNEVRSYQAVRSTADDVIRGAIFLLLVLLPFAYAAERLVLASAHVYRQIGGVFGIFALMTSVLWSFHPAFKMSSMPMMIVMAFGVIFMSLLVILVVFSKFESELEKMRSGKAESSSAKTSRIGLVSTAMRLGIANMRKRKLRTALTGVTVVLITFALLCFMSATTYVGKTEKTLDVKATAPAVLVRQPGERALPAKALTFLQNMVGKGRSCIPRYWWCNSWDPQWRLHVRNPRTGKQVSLTAGVGLAGGEARVTGIDRVCPDWDRFSRDGGCYVTKRVADELGISPGETVIIGGQSVSLIGVFDGATFDRDVQRLDGKSLLPPDYSLMDDAERRQKSRTDIQTIMLEMASGTAQDDSGATRAIASDDVVILPAEMLEGIKHASLRSVAMPAADAVDARTLATRLAKNLAFPVYFGSPEAVGVVASTPLAPKAPKSLLIPLLIAGFIIFNTMLSSLAERRGEIYIYTSLGLAPLHIGVLFLAEAVTYGLLGSIFGYVIGQGLATVFGALGWMGGITLNFGGTQAMGTMILVLVIVVVSSLVPAYLAGKVAAPSNEMGWAVPDPVDDGDGHVIRDVLPFTATSKTAEGVAAFLFEYFQAHEDGAIGHFTAGELAMNREVVDGRDAVTIHCTIWLAPYDLGVRQQLVVVVRELPEEDDLFEIAVELRHGAGQIRTWHRLNRTFLGNLRRQLLGWRKLAVESILGYISRGREIVLNA